MGLKEDEFALRKDTTVALWKDYMSFYGDVQKLEILGGDFVVVNEDLSENLNTKCIHMWIEAKAIVEAVKLLQIWCKASKLCLREVQFIEKIYFLIYSAHFDTFCEWLYRKRACALVRRM